MSIGTAVIENGNDQVQSRKESISSQKNAAVDIEEVYKFIGFGRVQFTMLLAGGLYLLMVINETLGFSMVTIASQCDFHTDSVDKATMSSASFLGMLKLLRLEN